MDSDNLAKLGEGSTVLCRKAWTAYLPTVLLVSVFLTLIALVYPFVPIEILATGIVAVSTYCAYRWVDLRSVRLFYDDSGVWVYAGVFPWSKGVRGVKWRDLDEGTYVQSFLSWALRSYDVRVCHRFTKESEIFLTSMHNGHKAIVAMNEIHRKRILVAEAVDDLSRT